MLPHRGLLTSPNLYASTSHHVHLTFLSFANGSANPFPSCRFNDAREQAEKKKHQDLKYRFFFTLHKIFFWCFRHLERSKSLFFYKFRSPILSSSYYFEVRFDVSFLLMLPGFNKWLFSFFSSRLVFSCDIPRDTSPSHRRRLVVRHFLYYFFYKNEREKNCYFSYFLGPQQKHHYFIVYVTSNYQNY